jgi:hypothetical protein
VDQLLNNARQARVTEKKVVLTRNAVHLIRRQAIEKIENRLLTRQKQLITLSTKVNVVLDLFKKMQQGNSQQVQAIDHSIAALINDIHACNVISPAVDPYNAFDCPLLVEQPRFKKRGEMCQQLGETVERCVNEFQGVLTKIRQTVQPLVQKRIALEQELIQLQSQEKNLLTTHKAEIDALASQQSTLQAEINALTAKKSRGEQYKSACNLIVKSYKDFENFHVSIGGSIDANSWQDRQSQKLRATLNSVIEKGRVLLQFPQGHLLSVPQVSISPYVHPQAALSSAQLALNISINTSMPKISALLAQSLSQEGSSASQINLKEFDDRLNQSRQRIHLELIGKMNQASQIASCFVQETSQLFASLEASCKNVENVVFGQRQKNERIKQQQEGFKSQIYAKMTSLQNQKLELEGANYLSARYESYLEAIVHCRKREIQCTKNSIGLMNAGFCLGELINYISTVPSDPKTKLQEFKQKTDAAVHETDIFNVCAIL